MPRKSTSTTPTRRQAGYALTIKCFVPMGDGLAAQAATLNTLAEMENGDLSSLREVIDAASLVVAAKQTSRKVAAAE